MTKGKGQNPADAYRKALRKKELKKNKAERTKAREFALVKKDTHGMFSLVFFGSVVLRLCRHGG
ncbi:hypothetical protein EDD15DRAFT_2209110 [Pisolithus albus]|nr:hypothetical protein EDD15DRAFT_2209110 [Pisolithus albus]